MTLPNFDDTEVAFKAYTDHQLHESYLIYKSLGYQSLVNFGTFVITKALSWHLPITPLVRHTIFKQFCGGVDAHDCFPIVEQMGQHGVGSILDYSVEALDSEDGMNDATEEFCETIEYGSEREFIPFAVFKVTGVIPFRLLEQKAKSLPFSPPDQQQWDRSVARFDRICATAAKLRLKLLIDAEETWIQGPIDELALAAMAKLNKDEPLIYNTYQMYLTASLEKLTRDIGKGKNEGFHVGVKLVRGAYMEKERARAAKMGYPSPVQPDKSSTDRDFDAAVKLGLESIGNVGLFIGTHNESSTQTAVRLMKEVGVDPADTRVYFSQLYGMSDNLSFNLARHGFLATKYLPYGPVKAVLPYLFRRAQENSSIKGQAGRELQLITRELDRRRS